MAKPALRRAVAVSVLFSAVAISGCQSGSSTHGGTTHERIKSDPNESFSSKEYGVAASPRVTDLKVVPKGGGRAQIGKPYKVRGKWYYPKDQPGYVKSGKASWYGASFHGRLTANGEIYDMFGLSAAHPTFPLPSYARVTNRKTGSSIMVRVNDRGPYVADRVLDVSSRAAELLGYKSDGVGDVKVEYVGKAPVDGDDTAILMASYRPGSASPLNDGMASGVMVASNEAPSRLSYASAPRSAAARVQAIGLPGVRPAAIPAATAAARTPGSLFPGGAVSVDSIISQAEAPDIGAAPLPTPPAASYQLVASSYAAAPGRTGAAGALAAIAAGGAPERIEIGLVEDQALVAAVRKIAEGRGRLVVDAGIPDQPLSVSLAIDAAPGADVDGLLQALWQAGADGAFVLRD
ncbi:septal ring lytic transglycosylase RlpA family protein [Aureimonas sp. SA4125]|uniref:septal ring lytic transglycosylase RlpA family protein n=1 Tax=Aureimonas sp. SA4125 TaxID=2826993 RepID=UPI0023DFC623|nr:septal ring lytic transglycosylase RlpA family protein [Aureimonas sp. SA4125]